jgi:hypothetical protein
MGGQVLVIRQALDAASDPEDRRENRDDHYM